MVKPVKIMSAIVLALGLGAVGGNAVQAQSAEAFYKGRDMKMIISAGQGGGYGTYAHALIPFMEKYIPGKPKIIIQHMQGAGGIVAANHLYNVAAKDGSVIALIHRGAVSTAPLFDAQGVKFDPTKFGWIGSMNNEVSLCASWHTSKVKSFKDLDQNQLIVGGLGPGSDTDMYPNLINNLFDTKMKLITGYNSGGAINLAFERGEIDGRCGWSWSSIESTRGQWIKENKITLLVQLGVDKHPELPNVPWIYDYAKTADDKAAMNLVFARQEFGRPYAGPPELPPAILALYRKAFDATMKDPTFLADAKKRKLDLDPITGAEIQKLVDNLYTTPPAVVARVRGILAK